MPATSRILLTGPVLAVIAVVGCGSTAPSTATGGTSSTGAVSSTSSAATETNVPGDIPDTQPFIAADGPAQRFSVSVPEGWSRRDQGGAVTYSSTFNSIRMETAPAATAPTADSATSAEVPQITSAGSRVASVRVSAATRPAGPVVLITYQADSPPDSVTGKVVRLDVERYEYWRSGTEAILTLSSPAGSDNVDPWRKVTDSFAWR